MAKVELIMPKMGESIIEATILNWVKSVGDTVEEDETILEIATDKVDSEIPSPVDGKLTKILFNPDDVVPVGTVIAIIETEGEEESKSPKPAEVKKQETPKEEPAKTAAPAASQIEKEVEQIAATTSSAMSNIQNSTNRFYSPLVKNIAKTEQITQQELDSISGSGAKGRVTKSDVLAYLDNRKHGGPVSKPSVSPQSIQSPIANIATSQTGNNVEIVEMDRMRRLIADHMVRSKHTSPHVTSFVEADVTNLVRWREKVKKEYIAKYGEKITYTPIIIEAVIKAIVDFPMINVSLDGNNILIKKDINIGMAAALPSGNLIVPVIKNANMLNMTGLVKSVNDLATRARGNKLKPDEIQGGTFTVTNVGTFGNVMGTPIINQPQVAIMAAGAIRKKPAVLETEHGDVIAIRNMMFLSLSYDHRIVDGFLGGSFLKRVSDYLEAFDSNRNI